MTIEHFYISGEAQLLQQLSHFNFKTVFDVGSNTGEWASLARATWPTAEIHTFELVPQTFSTFLASGTLDSAMMPNSFGLGNKCGLVDYKHCFEDSRLCTQLVEMSPGTLSNVTYEWRKGLVVDGDSYVASRQIESIDFLKIDVEGSEPDVLKGLYNSLQQERIGLIQFEYGTANILNKFLLLDYYQMLQPLGFELALLSADGLSWRDYILTHEDFRGPNYVALHRSRQDLAAHLKAHFSIG